MSPVQPCIIDCRGGCFRSRARTIRGAIVRAIKSPAPSRRPNIICTGDLSNRPHHRGACIMAGDMVCRPYIAGMWPGRLFPVARPHNSRRHCSGYQIAGAIPTPQHHLYGRFIKSPTSSRRLHNGGRHGMSPVHCGNVAGAIFPIARPCRTPRHCTGDLSNRRRHPDAPTSSVRAIYQIARINPDGRIAAGDMVCRPYNPCICVNSRLTRCRACGYDRPLADIPAFSPPRCDVFTRPEYHSHDPALRACARTPEPNPVMHAAACRGANQNRLTHGHRTA